MKKRVAGSFRDPDAHLFWRDGALYRQLNPSYFDDYKRAESSGLLSVLHHSGMLISHEEVEHRETQILLKPEILSMISYPYEWAFDQLRDAALLTLDIQKIALDHGLSLTDASAFNVQFKQGKPIFIDTASFTKYNEGEAWPAYRQFCQHFLAPLTLAAKRDTALLKLFISHLDGIPLTLTRDLLPFYYKWNPAIGIHIMMHANSIEHYAGKRGSSGAKEGASIPKNRAYNLIEHMKDYLSAVSPKQSSEWTGYYTDNNYKDEATKQKQEIVGEWLAQKGQKQRVHDVGANTGRYSFLAAEQGHEVIASDSDIAVINALYQQVKKRKISNLFPIQMDLMVPSPAVGWENKERSAQLERIGQADICMMLALIHHLVIANNVPFSYVAEMAAKLGKALIIEMVPKEDSQVQHMLSSRKDIFDDYTIEAFEAAFSNLFAIKNKMTINGSNRILYLMESK